MLLSTLVSINRKYFLETDTEDNKTAESAEKQGESGKDEGAEDVESKEKRKMSLGEEKKRKKITRGMSEQERYEILKDAVIPLTAKTDTARVAEIEEMFNAKEDNILSMKLKDKKSLFKKIGDEFGVFKTYSNEDVQIEFEYTKGGMDEGTQKQSKNYSDYLKMLSCFDKVIENAVGIEIHNRNKDGYKMDPTLTDVVVMASVFEDGERIIPVKLEVKEFSDKQNKLYVAITLQGIKKEEIVTQGDTAQNSVTQDAPSSVISIAQFFEKINPQEKNFTKYIPDNFLTSEQKAVKHDKTGKNSLREESVSADSEEQAPSAEEAKEQAQAVKDKLLSEEGSIGNEAEVKRASKLVKGFKLLSASERNAIIRMLRSAGTIEKATLSSVAHIMAIRPGLNVLFVSGIEGEGSHTELSNGERLILLDPTLRHGKKYRADIIFHELYHDLASTEDLSTLTGAVVKSASSEFIRKIVDRYTKYYNGESVTEWLNGKKYTKTNYNAYFKEHKGVSRATVEEEIAAACMAKVMGSSRFIKEYGGNVGAVRRVYYGLTRLARAIANRSVQIGEADDGFTISFRDVLDYKRAYEVALMQSERQMSEEDVEKLAELLKKRDEADVARATKYSLGDRRVYNGIREAFAKKELDSLSVRLGDRFPLARNFDGAMREDHTTLTLETVVKESTKKPKDKGYFVTGKKAFQKAFGGTKTTVHIDQLGIDAELYQNIATESMSKADGKLAKQTLLDVVPNIDKILKNSIVMAVERVAHTDNKATSLLAYRLYNFYWYQEGNKKNLHCLVCTVVQNTEQAEGHIFQDIENVTINSGLPGNNTDMPAPVDSDTYSISQLYRFVKGMPREKGGLKYSADERNKYAFSYTQRNDGTKYSLSPEQKKLRDEFLSEYESEDEIALRALNDYLESKGFSKKEIDAHSSVFAPEEEDVGESRRSMEGVRGYFLEFCSY